MGFNWHLKDNGYKSEVNQILQAQDPNFDVRGAPLYR